MLRFDAFPPEPGKITLTDFALSQASEAAFGSFHGQISAEQIFSSAIPEALVSNLLPKDRTEEKMREFFDGGLASQVGSPRVSEILLNGLMSQIRKKNV